MGEHKNNPVAQANAGQNPAEDHVGGVPYLRKLIDTPLTEKEGKIALAEIDVQVKQIELMEATSRQQRAAAEFDRAIIMRRMMNKSGEEKKPAMGQPVGGNAAEPAPEAK